MLAIVALPAAWAWFSPRVTRPTRVAVGVVFGLLAVGFGTVSHGLHTALLGPDANDITGLLFLLGGLALIGSAVAAAAAPRGERRSLPWLRAAGWPVGAFVTLMVVVMPLASALLITHAPRWAIHESALDIPHQEVRIGGKLAAWYVPPRNGATALLVHGSGGSRGRTVAHVKMLARNGYGVLALDLPGNGESAGRSNGLGDNAQPAVDSALDWLERRPETGRIAGYGLSLGAEVLLEAAAHDQRIRAVVADGPTRPEDGARVQPPPALDGLIEDLGLTASRAIAGTRPAPSITGLMPRIAPRPVLLVASSGFSAEIPANRVYARAGGPTTELYELQGVGHTRGLKRRPAAYEQRTIGFLDRALR
jgi:pimeloyl-ACP methyl ester carboxylesterase